MLYTAVFLTASTTGETVIGLRLQSFLMASELITDINQESCDVKYRWSTLDDTYKPVAAYFDENKAVELALTGKRPALIITRFDKLAEPL